MAPKVPQFDLNLKRRFDPSQCTLEDFRSGDAPMIRCLELAWYASRTELPVLLLGESGTGKTLLARAIHTSSGRKDGPFVEFNAGALSETLLDSQLFGHEKGAFTDAGRRVRGKFELSDKGTLFLDEIADMSPGAQAKILRAVEYGEFESLGSETLKRSDVRLISATHLTAEELQSTGRLRRDLYHRLNGLSIVLPPLRDRPRDLPWLLAAEVELAAERHRKEITGLTPKAALRLFSYSWPGNLRELNRVIRAAVAMTEGELIDESVLLIEGADGGLEPEPRQLPEDPGDFSLERAQQLHIRKVLRHFDGNKRQTALALGISRSTLDRKLAKGF